MKEVKCLSCRKTVMVELISYGGGKVAVCPECKQLAYNGDNEEQTQTMETEEKSKPSPSNPEK